MNAVWINAQQLKEMFAKHVLTILSIRYPMAVVLVVQTVKIIFVRLRVYALTVKMGNTGQTVNRTVIPGVKITYVTGMAAALHVRMAITLGQHVGRIAHMV